MLAIKEVEKHFVALNQLIPLSPICSASHYERIVDTMNALMDSGAADESHALAPLLAMLGELVGDYEDVHHQILPATGVQVLEFLMAQHALRQSDLPEVGSQGVVSEVLRGKRILNRRQIQALSERFGVSSAVFI